MFLHRLFFSIIFLGCSQGYSQTPSSPQVKADNDIKKYSTYLAGMKSFQASFVQIAPNGNRAYGTIYMKKPGRLRAIYTPPSAGIEIIADGERLIRYDAKNQESDSIRLEETPLYFFLSDGVLEDHVLVQKIFHGKDKTAITVVSKEDPEGGAVTMVFQDTPLCLLQWQVVDSDGACTTVFLSHIKLNITIPDNIFRMQS